MSRMLGKNAVAVAVAAMGLVMMTGCSTSGGGGGGTPGDLNGATDDGNGGAQDDTSAGYAAFTAEGCSVCHTTQSNNFSDSSVDDIVDVLLGEIPHEGGEFGDLTEQEIEDITDFLLAVMLGEEDLDGDDGGDDGEDGVETQAREWFEQVWTDFDERYSHFEAKAVDWDSIRDQYEPQFSADMNTDEFVAQIAEMLAELRDLHVWLFDTDGETVEVYTKTAIPNYPNFYPEGTQQMQGFPLWHGWADDNIAFISIESFVNEQWDGLRTGDVDSLFAIYAEADAMIIDVRFNNGGDETIAQAFAGHLTAGGYVYGYHRTKNVGPDHNDFGDFVEHFLDPADNELFLKPVACLIGETNMSSAEWFVLMMLENPAVTLIGDTTRGSSGNPQEFSLDNGIKYYIPSWEAYRADQTTKIEDVGIPPSSGYAIPPEESYTDEHDFVLERGIELLK